MAYVETRNPEADGAGGGPGEYNAAYFRLPLMVLVLVGLAVLFVLLLPRDPILPQRVQLWLSRDVNAVRQRQFEDQLVRLRAKDPPLGSVLPLPHASPLPAGLTPQPMAARRQDVLVLMIGSCSLCVMSTLRPADFFAKSHPGLAVVAVSSSDPTELRQVRQSEHLGLAFASDPRGEMLQRYNAVWLPRAYLLTGSGRLLWLQPGIDLNLQALSLFLKSGRH